MFLPTTREEMKKLNWDSLDIILISGDTYVDSPYNGSAIIGKWLVKHGYKVGIIAQPSTDSDIDILRLGIPNLYWGVSAGCVDSMVANYTATKKRRQKDDFTPGGENNKRPDRATLAYVNLIKRFTKEEKKPIVIGGIEASLRRITHYDFWTNKLRKSILFNSKADILSYGMGEKSMLELAQALSLGYDWTTIKGLCYISKEPKKGYLELPSHDDCIKDKDSFIKAFHTFYQNNDPLTAKGLYQKQDSRYLIQNPPSEIYTKKELDEIYDLDFEVEVHPYYKKMGHVKSIDTIRNSITTHRGCYGECNFCAIAVHQGRTVISRSKESILKEAKKVTNSKNFKGYISDLGGPTANMYELECKKKTTSGPCNDRRCLYPKTCPALKKISHKKQIDLLKEVRSLDRVKKVFIASGIRYDLILSDTDNGDRYLKEIVKNHVSGQMKIAPEHTETSILSMMGKQGKEVLKEFKEKFYDINKKEDLKQFLTYYLIAAHPGCTEGEMKKLKSFASSELKINPEQVQIFTPTPSTYSTLMYYTEKDPFTGKRIFVEKDLARKQKQKDLLIEKTSNYQGKSKNNRNNKNKDRDNKEFNKNNRQKRRRK